MPRAPMQVVVIPFRLRADGEPEFALFQRSDDHKWQPVAGGAEDEETPEQAARREAWEEAGTPRESRVLRLQTQDTVPVHHFSDTSHWPTGLYVVPQYSFGLDATGLDLVIGPEHTRMRWVTYSEAASLLAYQSNATALWELRERIRASDLPPAQ